MSPTTTTVIQYTYYVVILGLGDIFSKSKSGYVKVRGDRCWWSEKINSRWTVVHSFTTPFTVHAHITQPGQAQSLQAVVIVINSENHLQQTAFSGC